ncbi:DUF6282 family protein [Halorientalis litorea]|jgi:hypothetical protein|uniref:DUF6282 family protein n=1 Tax=Halorientalis litorea TaxID=2931977 RepID=UPI001FF5C76B|nr:DUF6282 family protein [Halorientalis litorea]
MTATTPVAGAWDTHVHAGPDVRPRKHDALTLARKATAMGMGGLVLKNHHLPTAMLAATVERDDDVDIDVAGMIVLNRSVGGLNVDAVTAAGEMGAVRVELPTMTARRNMLDQGEPETVDLLDESGSLSATARDVLDETLAYDMAVGTGHIGVEETRQVVEYVTDAGGDVVVTHPEFHAARDGVGLTPEEQAELATEGVYYERCYVTTADGITSLFRDDAPQAASDAFEPGAMFEEIVTAIEQTGPERNFVSTDYGQPDRESPPAGLGEFHERLRAAGVSASDLDRMARQNPAAVFGGA